MAGDIGAFESRKRTHPDVVKLRQQKCIDEMASIDAELRVIDGLLRDLQSRRTRSEKATAPSPVEFGFQFLRTRDELREMNAK